MRLIVQRVASAAVRVAGETVGAVGRGLLVLAGVEKEGGWKEKLPQMSEHDLLKELAANGNLVKRPVAIDSVRGIAVNGFKEAEWQVLA